MVKESMPADRSGTSELCPFCGGSINLLGGAKFCARCGASIAPGRIAVAGTNAGEVLEVTRFPAAHSPMKGTERVAGGGDADWPPVILAAALAGAVAIYVATRPVDTVHI